MPMYKTDDGYNMRVVEFDTLPELPIYAIFSDAEPYAKALNAAIRDGVITEPGTYGIQVEHADPSILYTIHPFTPIEN